MTDGTPEGSVATLLTPVENGEVVAALTVLGGAKGRVMEVVGGTLVVLDDTAEGAADDAARQLSEFTRAADKFVLVMERRDGRVQATRWVEGRRGEELPPGLVLDQVPGVVASLLTGTQTMDDLAQAHPEKVFEARMRRWKAFWALRRLSKQARREAQDRTATLQEIDQQRETARNTQAQPTPSADGAESSRADGAPRDDN